jgi:hypothetical protein
MVDVWAAGSLTTFVMLGIDKNIAERNVALPVHWSNLTYLQLRSGGQGYPAQHQITPILAACVNLIRFSVTLFSSVNEQLPAGPVAEATLPKLRTFEIFGSEAPLRGLASKLVLPSLTKLTMIFSASRPLPEGEAALTEWVNRFGDQLLDVSFDYVSLTQSALLHCLSRLPNVVRLEMTGQSRNYPIVLPFSRDLSRPSSAYIYEALAHLTPNLIDEGTTGSEGQAACFCPKLKELVCLMGSEYAGEAFAKLILARYGDGTKAVLQGGVARIEHVVLDFHREEGGILGLFNIMDAVYKVADPSILSLYVYYDAPEPRVRSLPSFGPRRVRSMGSREAA